MKSSKDGSSLVWPGFVDALCALLTVILFAFMIFVVSYIYLASLVQKKDTSLSHLEARIAKLCRSMSQKDDDLDQKNEQLKLTQKELDEVRRVYEELRRLLAQRETQLQSDQQSHMEAVKSKDQEILSLKDQLKALVEKMNKDLAGGPSEFFGKLKKALGSRQGIRMVGDRFIFESEILFPPGRADLGEKGKEEIKGFARALKAVMVDLPKDLPWILRVDGHTDDLPLSKGSKFSSNLDLSAARAISVIHFLIKQGVPENRLAAAGFGPFRSLEDKPHTSKNRPRDRRIELMIDQKY